MIIIASSNGAGMAARWEMPRGGSALDAVFRSGEHADKVATKERTELKKVGQEEFEIDVAAATGSELLRLIAAVDVIEIASARLAISMDGMFFDNVTERASADALLALIDGARGKSRR